jgi:hypothetical protein
LYPVGNPLLGTDDAAGAIAAVAITCDVVGLLVVGTAAFGTATIDAVPILMGVMTLCPVLTIYCSPNPPTRPNGSPAFAVATSVVVFVFGAVPEFVGFELKYFPKKDAAPETMEENTFPSDCSPAALRAWSAALTSAVVWFALTVAAACACCAAIAVCAVSVTFVSYSSPAVEIAAICVAALL